MRIARTALYLAMSKRAAAVIGVMTAILLVALAACTPSRIQPPRLIERGELDYPIEAKLAQIQGDVLLGLDIDEHGKVEQAMIDGSSGHPMLDDAALRYARTLRFRPATIDGRPIRAHTQLLLKFRLTQDKFDPARWMDQVLSLQAALEKAEGEKRKEILEDLLEAYVAFVRFARQSGRPALSLKVKSVVLPSVQRRWELFWGNDPTAFAVLDDFLERGSDVPRLRSIAENELLEMLLATVRQLRLEMITKGRDIRRKEQMIAAIESYLDERFPAFRGQLRSGPMR